MWENKKPAYKHLCSKNRQAVHNVPLHGLSQTLVGHECKIIAQLFKKKFDQCIQLILKSTFRELTDEKILGIWLSLQDVRGNI